MQWTRVVFDEKLVSKWVEVHIFWEGHKLLRNLHLTFDYIQSKIMWRFRKILWPSQNIWTLQTVGHLVSKSCIHHPEFEKIPQYYQDLWGIAANANNYFGLLFATPFFTNFNLKHASSYWILLHFKLGFKVHVLVLYLKTKRVCIKSSLHKSKCNGTV